MMLKKITSLFSSKTNTDKVHFNNDRNQTLPSNSFLKKNTIVMGGECLIVGLTLGETKAILEHAREKKIEGKGFNRINFTKLSEFESKSLGQSTEAYAIYLGHTPGCHHALFQSFGIPTK
jgi:hypothetical protein